ncbi:MULTISPECIES: hypothetical protein [Halomonadaceae]|uniref:hypothetical protein n=1 Tax=Halomonadaceae TaxID=28256 RepID=UPI001359C1BB|nr:MULTISPECIES: hypothetical protein [Halomonas]MCE8031579.1 hypothetical protein [Halomonas sp. MCCC 1A11057]
MLIQHFLYGPHLVGFLLGKHGEDQSAGIAEFERCIVDQHGGLGLFVDQCPIVSIHFIEVEQRVESDRDRQRTQEANQADDLDRQRKVDEETRHVISVRLNDS